MQTILLISLRSVNANVMGSFNIWVGDEEFAAQGKVNNANQAIAGLRRPEKQRR